LTIKNGPFPQKFVRGRNAETAFITPVFLLSFLKSNLKQQAFAVFVFCMPNGQSDVEIQLISLVPYLTLARDISSRIARLYSYKAVRQKHT
jgi:hypothetical protein